MNESKKNASIDYILAQGLVAPQTTRSRIAEMFRNLGLRCIFWDTGYSLLFAALTFALVMALFVVVPYDYRFSAAVAVAPLFFLLINLFTETSERACGLYEIKQTCRYTIRQITALRVLYYSVVGAVFTAIIAVIKMETAYEFFSILTLCLAALFICAALSISIVRYLRKLWANAAFSVAWIFVTAALTFSLGEPWENLLSNTPIIISATVALIGITFFIYQVSKMLSEEKTYAFAQ
ncbi:MAG: hypothetical protein FWH20_07045 [Oscillospiraceae bacterium]|nr:hypothetical protein [Oscillospiraceae bacterium]